MAQNGVHGRYGGVGERDGPNTRVLNLAFGRAATSALAPFMLSSFWLKSTRCRFVVTWAKGHPQAMLL